MKLCNYGELWRLMTGHTYIEYGNETVTELPLEEAGGHGSSMGLTTPHIILYYIIYYSILYYIILYFVILYHMILYYII